MKELVLGGARSGKSCYAETAAQNNKRQSTLTDKSLYYVATARPDDGEMAERIAHHIKRRESHWTVVEEPIALANTLSELNIRGNIVVVDCLTLWMTNLLCTDDRTQLEAEKAALITVMANLQCDLYLISNEVGSGIVPLGALSREFVDQCGWLHQTLAVLSDKVTLVVAGLPLSLKN